ncbi:hypothetical protein K458DRAFT_416430 [Lentithecium fluviatile CBS 122367]|uniref:Uncharacterized protein n=1 Tax=Lentithecium fluviatile CBS 122367 TaxID=1168545 RepID=A0A6G1J780_9PLEO|nr:hypothetical protein K458DRAFT_416430 [Lentithecium fluviatile CBS 122367]
MSTPSAREVPYYRKWISEIRNYDGSKPFQGMDIDPFPLGVYERNQKVCYVHHLGGADCGGLCHLCLLRSQELHKSFVKRLQGWRFALTQDGTFCLVPVHAMCGDTIAIVLGMSTPLLLRPCTGGEFCVVGRCYVHGFMDGEAVDDIRQVMDDAGAKEFEGKECNNELWMRLQEEGLQELVLV